MECKTEPLYAHFLGSFALSRDGASRPLGRSKVVLELCCYLLARVGQHVARDELVELLWPEADPRTAVHRLHVAVSGLRALLTSAGCPGASAVQLDNDRYVVPRHTVQTDFAEFDRLFAVAAATMARGDARQAVASMIAALALYHGDFLADYPYADWASPLRAYFSERRQTGLTFLCEQAVAERKWARALELAQRQLDFDCLRERALRHVMRSHYALGQRGLAIRAYLNNAKQLEQEFGVRPSLETQRLYDAVCGDLAMPAEPAIHL